MATTKKPKGKETAPKLHVVSKDEINNKSIKVITKSFNTSSIKHIVLPKFLVDQKMKHAEQAKILDKGFIVLVFESPTIVPNGNLYKELLDAVKEGDLRGLTIDLYNGLSVWKIEEPRIRSIDFGQLNLDSESSEVILMDEEGNEYEGDESQLLQLPQLAVAKNPQQQEKTEIVVEIDYSGITINGTTVWCVK